MPDDDDSIRQEKPLFPVLEVTSPEKARLTLAYLVWFVAQLKTDRSKSPQIGRHRGEIAPPLKRYK